MLSFTLFFVLGYGFGIELPLIDMLFIESIACFAAFAWFIGKGIEECIDSFWKKGKK